VFTEDAAKPLFPISQSCPLLFSHERPPCPWRGMANPAPGFFYVLHQCHL
jgi:hypothetical protein